MIKEQHQQQTNLEPQDKPRTTIAQKAQETMHQPQWTWWQSWGYHELGQQTRPETSGYELSWFCIVVWVRVLVGSKFLVCVSWLCIVMALNRCLGSCWFEGPLLVCMSWLWIVVVLNWLIGSIFLVMNCPGSGWLCGFLLDLSCRFWLRPRMKWSNLCEQNCFLRWGLGVMVDGLLSLGTFFRVFDFPPINPHPSPHGFTLDFICLSVP